MNKEELIDWIDRPPSNHDLDNINYIICTFKQNEQLKTENQQLKSRIDKALTLLQLIQMYDEVDWGDINTLINILKESDVK